MYWQKVSYQTNIKKIIEKAQSVIPQERIENRILLIRNTKVMLDRDLAELYGVSTKVFNQTVKRNFSRFPENFMFQLTKEEKDEVVTNCDHLVILKFSPVFPYAFTEYGVVMLSSILNSEKAIKINLLIVNAFIKMRDALISYQELRQRIENMEKKIDQKFRINSAIFEEVIKEVETVKRLLEPEKLEGNKIGFKDRENGE